MVAYITGLIASLTPCTIVLIPILLYRFGISDGSSEKAKWREIILLLLGFLISLVITGLALHYISQGQLINALRVGLSILLVSVGILQVFGRLKLSQIRSVTHPFVLGLVLPWTLSLSPCVLPYLSIFITKGILSDKTWLEFLLFGAGLITPAIAIALLGERLLEHMRSITPLMKSIERYSGILIIIAGVYLGLQTFELGDLELAISSGLLLLMLLAAGYVTFIRNRSIRIANILIFLALLLFWGTLTFHCKSFVDENNNADVHYLSCSDRDTCPACRRCTILFATAAAVGTVGYIASGYKIRITRKASKQTSKNE